MIHVHDYDWVCTEIGSSWIRLCECGFSPEHPAWRVLVTGSRSHADETLIHEALDAELDHATTLGLPVVVVEGECPYGGADRFAASWANDHDVVVDPFPANWEVLGKRAGPYRNQQMVDAGADVCLAFPTKGSRGTWDCVHRAEAAGIPVKVVGSDL